jgi:hypothetical protein
MSLLLLVTASFLLVADPPPGDSKLWPYRTRELDQAEEDYITGLVEKYYGETSRDLNEWVVALHSGELMLVEITGLRVEGIGGPTGAASDGTTDRVQPRDRH